MMLGQVAALADTKPSRFRRATQPVAEDGLGRKLARRWLVTLGLLAVLVPLMVGTRRHWFGEVGLGYAVYWLHDRLYLPLKGYLWTWGFPVSLVAWLEITLLLLVALAGFLSGRPLLRGAHSLVARHTLATPLGRRMIDHWHRLTVATPFRPRQLELLAEQSRQTLLDGSNGALPISRLVALTGLCMAMRLRADDRVAVRVTILADLLETLLRIEQGKQDARTVRPAMEQLAQMMADHLIALTATPVPGDLLAPATLAGEVQVLLTALRGRLSSGKGGDLLLLRPVAATVMERCGLLDMIRTMAERGLRGFGRDLSVPEVGPASSGRLALLIALFAAVETGETELAHATLESMSALAFARGVGLPAPVTAFADALLAEAPDLPHWQLAAHLPEAPQPDPSLLTPGDHDHFTGRTRRLTWIAGAAEATP
jgi:hypothetical protein